MYKCKYVMIHISVCLCAESDVDFVDVYQAAIVMYGMHARMQKKIYTNI